MTIDPWLVLVFVFLGIWAGCHLIAWHDTAVKRAHAAGVREGAVARQVEIHAAAKLLLLQALADDALPAPNPSIEAAIAAALAQMPEEEET